MDISVFVVDISYLSFVLKSASFGTFQKLLSNLIETREVADHWRETDNSGTMKDRANSHTFLPFGD